MGGYVEQHLPLMQHMADSGAVAGRLWDDWLPRAVRESFQSVLGDSARSVLQFLAATHDVGKASPAFAAKVPVLATVMHPVLDCAAADRDPQGALRIPHSLVSFLAIHDWLCEQHAWAPGAAASAAVVSGGHHGIQPSDASITAARRSSHLVGTGAWASVRIELLDHFAQDLGVEDWLAARAPLPQSLQVLATAFVIVSDWIASNASFFPLVALGQGRDWLRPTEQRCATGWERLGMPRPWLPPIVSDDVGPILARRFPALSGLQPRPLQAAAFDAAHAMTRPGLLILEAPTGEGKTEAALLAAEVLAAKFGLGGVGFYLPTQATTDAMFLRTLDWLRALPDDGGVGSTAKAVALLHGRALHNTTYRDLSEAAGDLGIWDDTQEAPHGSKRTVQPAVHDWLEGQKRSSLADFSTGTIDQFLLLALRAKHLPLRHLGAARKVMVLDEVHAADTYMRVYLHRALEWCGALGVPIIGLSATLPREQRDALHAAYARGAQAVSPAEPRKMRTPAWQRRSQESALPTDLPYPVITASSGGDVTVQPVLPSSRSNATRIELADDDDDATLLNLLMAALADGGCVLVIRNTVTRAQATEVFLSKHFGSDVRLMHARFIGHHRLANDAWLRDRLGPQAGATRPRRAIIVSTQVVEQSLDIDADLLITDLAPADLLVQRIGRLHRHVRGEGQSDRPPLLREARCVVVGVQSWAAEPPQPVNGSARVYGAHLLMRTATVLLERVATDPMFVSPRDVAPFVQSVYSDRAVGPEDWQEALDSARREAAHEHEKKCHLAQGYLLEPPRVDQQAILNWIGSGGKNDQEREGLAQVRDGADSLEVIVLRESQGSLHLLEGIPDDDGSPVPENGPVPEHQALLVAGSIARLPSYLSLGKQADELITALNQRYYEHWQRDPLLKGHLVLVLDEDGTAVVGKHRFSYNARSGLEVGKA